MIETRHLLHVLAVANHRHFGRAAAAVNLTQPALSQSIQAVERGLGVRLFDRGRKGAEPTSFGRIVIERGERVLTEVREIEREIALRRGLVSGRFAVVMAPYPGALSGQRAVARLLAEHPGISCQVRVGDWRRVTRYVLEGSTDLGVADLGVASGNSDLQTIPLCTRPLHFVCRPGHPLVSLVRVTIHDLAEYPWVAIRAPSRMSEFLPDPPGRAGSWDPRSGDFVPAIETDVMNEFWLLARETDAVVLAPLTLVEEELEAGQVAVIPFAEPWFRFNYGFILRRGRTLPPAAEEFMRIVHEIEQDLDEREAALRERFAAG